uniref:Hyaluronidase n=1 Tax=Geotrypetes seraphini TaxID=260995 RepID=A0A6P8SHE7_GEOSA|nr:hyaluronidase-like isoform X2 [Geotrypetes seraphini]
MWETCKKFCLKWLAIMMLFNRVPCKEIRQAKTPLLHNKPFIIVWNAPTEQCKFHYNVDLDLNVFDIVANTNETLSGSKVTIFYHTQLGYYPYFADDGAPVNGGIPQNQSLSKHLDKAKSDLNHFIPLKNFQGLGVIDWEEWRPQWDRNWGNKTIYRNKSVELVKTRYPQWSNNETLKAAKEEFENAGKNFMSSTLLLVKQLRPDGFWGYYLYPDCYNYDYKEQPQTYTGMCPNLETSRNDKLLWLWKESSALFPSIYLDSSLKSSPNALKFVHHRIKEAIRVALMARNDSVLPIFAYAMPFYIHTLQGLTENSCSTVKKYINGQLGHYIVNVTSAAELCSEALCRKNGKCVRKAIDSSAYLHLNPASFGIQTLLSGRGVRFRVRGDAKVIDVQAMNESFLCRCYEGWAGISCELKNHNGTSKEIPHRIVLLTLVVQVLFFIMLQCLCYKYSI